MGTYKVLNSLPTGLSGFSPSGLTDFNGTLFFIISGYSYNNQLWKTDGTARGTILVKDFFNGQGALLASLSGLTVIKNKLYFTGYSYSANYTSILCVTDGFTNGTHIISNSIAEPAQMIAGSLNSNDSSVYFSASAISNGKRYLYVTNGDSGNAHNASGFNGFISNNYYGIDLINKNGVIYFVGRTDSTAKSQGLYKFDISAANGIQPVKTVPPAGNDEGPSDIYSFTNIDSTLYFTWHDGLNNKNQLWKSDGNIEGNILLKNSITASNFTGANTLVYFTATNISTGSELWKTDGSANGTSIVKDIYPGYTSSYPFDLTFFNGKLLFGAQDDTHGSELWKSDGTETGTVMLKDINQSATSPSYPIDLTAIDNKLFFIVDKKVSKLWKTDGTNSGTEVINDTVNIISIYYSGNLVTLKYNTFFFATSISGKQGIYKTDGTAQGTLLVKEIQGKINGNSRIIATDSLVYFYLSNSLSNTFDLWRSDGTGANTYVIKKDLSNVTSSSFVSAGNTLYFILTNDHSLWKTDGTTAGTAMVKTFASDPTNITGYKNLILFSALDGSSRLLWKSDGTVTGTIKVTDKGTEPGNFITSNGELFFTAFANANYFGNIGTELFKTNGTETGTVLVKDIHAGSSSTNIYKSISANNILYFFTNQTSTGSTEL